MPPQKHSASFNWLDITPTTDVRWHPCFGSLECARLEVPLDWTAHSDPRTVAIALTKVPAVVPEESPEWSGPVLTNPGGPGGSGVEFISLYGRELQTIVGNTHSIIGFDPRGVNNTTPATSCFPSEAARKVWWLRAGGKVVGYSSDGQDLAIEYARSKSLGSVCGEAIADGAGADFAGTPNVARDMLAIVEAAWNAVGVDGRTKGLRYWGFSYGTVLGQTFASMFPDRAERVVVDGVVDIDDYYDGGWRRNLQDADKVIESFFSYCSSAGSVCALSEATPELVAQRFKKLLSRVRKEPVPVYGDRAPDWVADADIRTIIFWSLYNPIQRFPLAASALAALEAGDASKVSEIIHFTFDCDCTAEQPPNTGIEADSAILCQDGNVNNLTLKEFAAYVEDLKSQSEMIGGNWARIAMACTGWRSPARGLVPWRHSGYSGWSGKPWGASTSHPMLFVSTKLDPVTPLQNAENMRRRFAGAGLLVQDSVGHCSLAAPSACMATNIRDYFANGTVHAETVRCGADAAPWSGLEKTVGKDGWAVVEGDVELSRADRRLADGWSPVIPGGLGSR